MKYNITMNGRTYEVEVELCQPQLLSEFQSIAPVPAAAATAAVEAAPTAAPAAPAAAVAAGTGDAITAPMPGTILKVNAAVGDAVKAGQVLIVLEAMKMENEILSPKDGVIKQVLTSKGSSVDTGAPLVVLG